MKLFLTGENSWFDSQDIPTGISRPRAAASSADTPAYLPDGRLAPKTYKGIVVKKGKKMINRQ